MTLLRALKGMRTALEAAAGRVVEHPAGGFWCRSCDEVSGEFECEHIEAFMALRDLREAEALGKDEEFMKDLDAVLVHAMDSGSSIVGAVARLLDAKLRGTP